MSFQADGVGRPSLPPDRYFRLLLLGYFEELDTEQLIAWRRRLAEHANVSGLRPQRGPTDDATHGARQLTSYSGHYDGWRYLPLLPFLIFDLESEK